MITAADAPQGAPGLRAVAAGSAAVALACAAHVLAGGAVPHLLGVLVLLLLTVPVLRAALGTRPSPRRLALVMVGAQAGLHGAFSVAAAAVSSPSASMSDAGHGMVMGTTSAVGSGTWAMVAHHLVGGFVGAGGLTMTALHLLAAGALGLWIAAGDQVLMTLVDLVLAPRRVRVARARAALLAACLRLAHDTYLALLLPRRTDPGTAPRPDPALVSVVVRRGPPAMLQPVPA